LYGVTAYLLIAANVFVFWFLRHTMRGALVEPYLLLSPNSLLSGNIASIISSGFVHKNIYHLIFNMIGIFIFARIVEKHFGVMKTLMIYFGSLTASMFLSIVFYTVVLHKNVIILGASGALMGLVSTAMLIDPFRVTFEMLIPVPVILKAWFFLYADIKGFLGGEKDGVSHVAHLFGFFSIALLVYFLNKKEKQLMRKGLIVNVITFIILLLLNQWVMYKTGKHIGMLLERL